MLPKEIQLLTQVHTSVAPTDLGKGPAPHHLGIHFVHVILEPMMQQTMS
jgi:hypothetical protein